MKISILAPTRARPHSMQRLWESAWETADHKDELEIVFYMDKDDIHSHEQFLRMDSPQHLGIIGERIVLSQMWNECQKVATGEIFMHAGDDIIFRTASWDTHVREAINSFPDKIAFVHGRDGIQDEKLGTHGFLHKNWVDTIGYFVPPYFSCDYNDTWLTDVSSMINRRIYVPSIYTEHMHWAVGKQPRDQTYSDTVARGNRDNVTEMYNAKFSERQADAAKLLAFIKSFEGETK